MFIEQFNNHNQSPAWNNVPNVSGTSNDTGFSHNK